jgi:CBS-domain-containing membrane protein
MGSFMPPVALTAVIAAQVVDEPNYLKIVKPLIIPSLVAICVGVLMIRYATQIARIIGV